MIRTDCPDYYPVTGFHLPKRLLNALAVGGIRNVGEIRDLSDKDLLSLQGFGEQSLRTLRELFGPSRVLNRPLHQRDRS